MLSAIHTANNPDDLHFTITFDPRFGYDLESHKNMIFNFVDPSAVSFIDPHPYLFSGGWGRQPKDFRPGLAAGLNMDNLIDSCKSDNILIADSDVCFLMPGWDDYLFELYSPDDCPVVAASGNAPMQNWLGGPFGDFMLLHVQTIKDNRIRMCKIDVPGELDSLRDIGIDLPCEGNVWIPITEENSHIWGKPPGDKVYTENTWKLNYILHDQNINYEVFECDHRLHDEDEVAGWGPKGPEKSIYSLWYKSINIKNDYVCTHMAASRKRKIGGAYYCAWMNDIYSYWDSISFDYSKFLKDHDRMLGF
jgi:hypothetical protein